MWPIIGRAHCATMVGARLPPDIGALLLLVVARMQSGEILTAADFIRATQSAFVGWRWRSLVHRWRPDGGQAFGMSSLRDRGLILRRNSVVEVGAVILLRLRRGIPDKIRGGGAYRVTDFGEH